MVTKNIMLIVKYMEENLQVETIGAIVILTLIIIATVGLVFLLFRGVRLWYWRVNDQVAALEKINQKLEELNQVMPAIAAPQPVLNEEPKLSEEEEAETPLLNEQDVKEPEDSSALPPDVQDKPFVCVEKKEGYNVGKNGKIYSENELRQQIQF